MPDKILWNDKKTGSIQIVFIPSFKMTQVLLMPEL
jgi:hypothetical protein